MIKIAIDIDDTLYSFSQLAREKFAEVAIERGDKTLHRGAYMPWTEWRSPTDIGNDPNYWLHIIDLCHQPEAITQQIPYKDASDTVWDLYNQGYHIKYISNRSPDAYDATKEWLFGNYFPIDEDKIELVCTNEDKISLISDCQYLIDDRPKTLVQFVYDYTWKFEHRFHYKERIGFGVFGDYNRSLTDVPGIYLAPNWKLLRFFLEEKGVLNVRDSASNSVGI